jgi:hypothetical protein
MAFKNELLFIIGIFLIIGFLSCDNSTSDSDPEPKEPDIPESIEITAPSASTTYWDDEPIACAHNQPEYADKAEWLVNDEPTSCVDGELDTELAEGEHTITLRFSAEGQSVKEEVKITVKEGFSVSLDKLKDELFVGEEVKCSATVTPEMYRDALEITVGGESCANGPVVVAESGELTARAWVTVDGRTEAAEQVLMAKPVVAGKVYPLTDRGVSSSASGFTVTLTAGGKVIDVETASDGSFTIKSDRISELADEQMTLEVSETGNFYGARAEGITAEEILALVESDELGFILAPKSWQIRCGPFSGQSTTIKLPEAFSRYERDDGLEHFASFYMLVSRRGEYFYRRWLPENRPLPTAFDREESEVAITAADSTAFWDETTKVEERICRGDLLVPATEAEVPNQYNGVQIRSKAAGTVATGGARISSSGIIKGGLMHLPIDKFGAERAQAGYAQRHELAQVFGFGEQNHWVGITSSNMSTSIPGGFSRYSVDDVAHIQLYMDTVDLQAEEDVSFGVYEWRQVFDIPSLPDN